jgi:nickel-dependent lactate racemase
MPGLKEALSAVLSEKPDAKIHLMPYGGQTLPVKADR